MGLESALVVGGLAVGATTSLVGAGMNFNASYAEASALRQQGDLTYYDSLMQANQVEMEAEQYQQSQTMKYAMSGVSLQGTPMQVLDHTEKQANMEIEHIESQGARQRELMYLQAGYAESGARAQLVSSVANTVLSTVSGISRASTGGIFDSSSSRSLGVGQTEGFGSDSIFNNEELDSFNAWRGMA